MQIVCILNNVRDVRDVRARGCTAFIVDDMCAPTAAIRLDFRLDL